MEKLIEVIRNSWHLQCTLMAKCKTKISERTCRKNYMPDKNKEENNRQWIKVDATDGKGGKC